MEQDVSLITRILAPFFYPALPMQRIFWLYLAAAVPLALVAYRLQRAGATTGRQGGFLAFCFPRAVFTHPSAQVDYRYFIINRIAFPLLLGPLVLSVATASGAVQAVLADAAGGEGLGLSPGPAAAVLLTLLSLLAADGAIFLTHYLQHRVPLFWEFHKIHHSAEVLTPITVYRMHPVDELFTGAAAGLCVGLVQGGFAFVYDGISEHQILGLNAGLFLFYVAGYNLRHSHIWLAYPGWLSHVLVSPAQHQVHHSRAPEHFDRNFGFTFAFWDWMAGTLYVPRRQEKLAFGLDGMEHRDYDSVWRLYAVPFSKLRARMRASRKASA